MMDSGKLWNKTYILLMFAQVFTSFSYYMVMTILVSYLTSDRVGISTAAAGMISGLFFLIALVCRPFCGVLSDKLNKLSLVKVAVIMMGVGTLGYSLSTSLQGIIFFRIVNGVGFAVNSTALISLVTQYIPRSHMGEGIGYFGLAHVIASAAGPGLGAATAECLGIRGVFLVSSGICLIEVIMLCAFSFDARPDVSGKKRRRFVFNDVIAIPALGYTLVASVFSVVNGIISTYLVVFGTAIHITGISLYFTLNAVTLFLVRPVAGRMMDQKGAGVVVIPGILVTAASMMLLGMSGYFGSGAFTAIMLSGILRGIGQGSAHPALQTVCIQKVGKEKSGAATSTFYLGGDVGQGFGPVIAGMIISAYNETLKGYQMAFWMSAWLLLASFALFIFLWKKERLTQGREEVLC